jgi:hypothetical protein
VLGIERANELLVGGRPTGVWRASTPWTCHISKYG